MIFYPVGVANVSGGSCWLFPGCLADLRFEYILLRRFPVLRLQASFDQGLYSVEILHSSPRVFMRHFYISFITLLICLTLTIGFHFGEQADGAWVKIASDYHVVSDLKNLQVSDYEWANGLLASECRKAGLQQEDESTLQVYLLPSTAGLRLEFWGRRDVEINDKQLDQISQIAIRLLREAQGQRK
jgi:hypothetical protein